MGVTDRTKQLARTIRDGGRYQEESFLARRLQRLSFLCILSQSLQVKSLVCLLFTVMIAAPLRSEESFTMADLQKIQSRFHRLIDEAEPGIACILVSRDSRYRDFEALATPTDLQLGKLGEFDARTLRKRPLESEQRRRLVRQLDLSDPEAIPDDYGSGIVIDSAGLILTNQHVIRGAVKIYVRLPNQGGSWANILAADPRSDLAVLRLLRPPQGLKALRIGAAESIRKGDFILVLANPFNAGARDGTPSVAGGIISGLRRRPFGPIKEEDRRQELHRYGTLLQTDARLNLGCSGGAVLNLNGEVIAMTTALAAVVGGESAGGYAIPLDAGYRRIIETLRRGEEFEYGRLGIAAEEDYEGPGISVQAVAPGSPAARAGLKPGDVVLQINNQSVYSHDDLFLQTALAGAGSRITLRIRSPGRREENKELTVGKSLPAENLLASSRPPAIHGLRVEYTDVLALVANLREVPFGVAIRSVEPGSPAAGKLKPLQEGGRQVIVAVNGVPIGSPSEFVREAAKRSTLTLLVVEAGRVGEQPKTVSLP